MSHALRSRLPSVVLSLGLVVGGCTDDPPVPTGAQATPTAAQPSASATAAPTATASALASAEPAASASAAASAPSAKLLPAEPPAETMPERDELATMGKEIVVRASSEQQCTTKVLYGWFEIACGPAEGLVRPSQVEVLSGFDAKRALLEIEEKGVTFRWVAPLPASGERAQARLSGAKLHEIFLTLDHGEEGWKGQLSGKRPE